MRPDSPETILLMLGCLQKSGVKTAKLPDELVLGLLCDPDDLEDDY